MRERRTLWSVIALVVGVALAVGAVVVSWMIAMSLARQSAAEALGALEVAHVAGLASAGLAGGVVARMGMGA